MATVSSADDFRIFKFPGTGLVALCEEVAAFVRSGNHKVEWIDLTSARYEKDEWGNHNIVFDYLPKEEV